MSIDTAQAAPGSAPSGASTGLAVAGISNTHVPPSPVTPRPRRSQIRRRRRIRRLVEWLAVLALAALAAGLLRTFVVQVYYVPSTSMTPTLQVGDRILVDKFLFHPSSLRDGDVVVFSRPPGDVAGVCDDPTATDLVKRIVALPGQTVKSIGNTIYVDGSPQPEPYLPKGTILGPRVVEQRIPQGRYFVMGDNRSQSCDSRYWGTIKASTIVGRVVTVIWRHGRPAFHSV